MTSSPVVKRYKRFIRKNEVAIEEKCVHLETVEREIDHELQRINDLRRANDTLEEEIGITASYIRSESDRMIGNLLYNNTQSITRPSLEALNGPEASTLIAKEVLDEAVEQIRAIDEKEADVNDCVKVTNDHLDEIETKTADNTRIEADRMMIIKKKNALIALLEKKRQLQHKIGEDLTAAYKERIAALQQMLNLELLHARYDEGTRTPDLPDYEPTSPLKVRHTELNETKCNEDTTFELEWEVIESNQRLQRLKAFVNMNSQGFADKKAKVDTNHEEEIAKLQFLITQITSFQLPSIEDPPNPLPVNNETVPTEQQNEDVDWEELFQIQREKYLYELRTQSTKVECDYLNTESKILEERVLELQSSIRLCQLTYSIISDEIASRKTFKGSISSSHL